MVRPFLEAKLPDWIEPHWYSTHEEAMALAPHAEIGWFDMYSQADMKATIEAATSLKWLNTVYTGLDFVSHDMLRDRGVTVTYGVGINAVSIAEYVVMMMLNMAKGIRAFGRAQDRGEWLQNPPGTIELEGSKALLIGYGAIGGQVKRRLDGFGVEVTTVRRSPQPDSLGPDEWRTRLGDFDWVILAVPSTPDTDGMIGAAELAAMKPTSHLLNIARGSVVDQPALVEALENGGIAGAYLDVTSPEPLPEGHPLWTMHNVYLTFHLSRGGITEMMGRAVKRFVANLELYSAGKPLEFQMDLERGY